MQSYKDKGYSSEALLNSVALMGWSPPHYEDPVLAGSMNVNEFFRHEAMSVNDMLKTFSIEKVGKSPVKFDEAKLDYLNA